MIKKCTKIGAGRMMLIISDRTEGGASMASVGTGGGGSWARDNNHYCYGDDDDVYGGGGIGGVMIGQTCASIDKGKGPGGKM